MPGFFTSVVRSKCPRCNLDNLYVDNNPYHLSKLGQMKKCCDKCGQKYEPETGFYYGAMYVSYGLGIALLFVPAYILYMLFDFSFTTLMVYVLSVYVLTFPLMFRWSRNIWLNMFVKYDSEVHNKFAQKA